MKLLTWNLWQYSVPWGYDAPRGIVPHYPPMAPRLDAGALWLRRRAAILAMLAAERPDLVLVQEAATDADAAPGAPNQAAQLAAALDYTVVYAPASTSRRRAAEFGQAVLAAPGWTLGDPLVLDLPSVRHLRKDSTRNALIVDVQGPGGPLRLLNAHFSLDPAARLRSVAQILAWVAAHPVAYPTLLAGDLNDVPGSAPITRLAEAGWQDAWATLYPEDPGLTFATPAPFIRLDYLFLAPGSALVPRAARRVGLAPDAAGFYPSDHVGLLVEFLTQMPLE